MCPKIQSQGQDFMSWPFFINFGIFYEVFIMFPNKIHIILSRLFFCPSILLDDSPLMSSSIYKLLVNYGKSKGWEINNNYFISNFGKIELFDNAETSPFILNIFSKDVYKRDKKMLFPCFGSRGNFSIKVFTDIGYISFTPIIHLYPYGVVNIILSGTYVTEYPEYVNEHLDFLKLVRRSFEKGATLSDLKITKNVGQNINNLNDVVRLIKGFVNISYPEFDFNDSFHRNYQLYNIIKSNVFNSIEFELFCQKLISNDQIPARLNKLCFDCYDGYWKEMLFVHPCMCVSYNRANNELCKQDTRRKKGWNIYRYIEFAIIEQFLWDNLLKFCYHVQEKLFKEKTSYIVLSKLKKNVFKRELYGLYLNLLQAFRQLNGSARKIIYMYYGGKNKRNELIESMKEEITSISDTLNDRKNPFMEFLGYILSLLSK